MTATQEVTVEDNHSSHLKQNGMNGMSSIPPRAKSIVGCHVAMTLAGPHMVDNLERLEIMNPSLGRHILENGFGGTTLNSGMAYREWALLTMGVLTAMGDCADQLDVYTEAAQLHGATEAEIMAVINHASSFVGAPRAVNSMRRIRNRLQAARSNSPPSEYIVRLNDHDTLVRDTKNSSNTTSGPPIILLHALSMDGYMFNRIIPALSSDTGARVLTYDLRGHGFARGAPLTQSLEHLVADLSLLLDTLQIPIADIYGASYGGAVAQYFAIAHPQRVRSLGLMATSSTAHISLLSRATRAEEGEMKALRIEAIMRWFLPETIADNTWCVRYARHNVESVRVEEWAAAWKAMSRLDCLDLLAGLDVPILVLAGGKDLSSTPERMRPIAERVGSRAKYVEIEGGTHMMVMEMAEAVAGNLIEFRKGVDGESL